MLTRRIATGVCALCLAIPAAAGASDGTNTHGARGPDGIIPAGPGSAVTARGPYGIPPAGQPSTVKARGPYGTPPAGPRRPVKASGPYGIPAGAISQNTTGASVHGRGASAGDDTNGWRTAAISEAALLATVLLGFALLVPARRRAADMVT